MKDKLAQQRKLIEQAKGQYSLLKAQQSSLEKNLGEFTSSIEDWTIAQTLLQKTASLNRLALKNLIEPIISQALKVLLGPNARFEIQFSETKTGVEAHLITVDNEGIEGEGFDTHGGGVLDTESVLLRILFLESLNLPKIVILDEPYRNVHGHASLEKISEFLQRLGEEMGFQVIMVTGDEESIGSGADNIISLHKEKGLVHVR